MNTTMNRQGTMQPVYQKTESSNVDDLRETIVNRSLDGYSDEEDENITSSVAEDTNAITVSSYNSTNLTKEEQQERLAQRETRHVLCLRLVVCLILLAAALAVSLIVHNLSVQAEQQQFEVQFQGAATKVTGKYM